MGHHQCPRGDLQQGTFRAGRREPPHRLVAQTRAGSINHIQSNIIWITGKTWPAPPSHPTPGVGRSNGLQFANSNPLTAHTGWGRCPDDKLDCPAGSGGDHHQHGEDQQGGQPCFLRASATRPGPQPSPPGHSWRARARATWPRPHLTRWGPPPPPPFTTQENGWEKLGPEPRAEGGRPLPLQHMALPDILLSFKFPLTGSSTRPDASTG